MSQTGNSSTGITTAGPISSEEGKDLNNDIGSLARKGLETDIQRALDIVRVTGNDAVHPGVIDLNDNKATAVGLFQLLNLIVERLIAMPNRIEAVFSDLPPGKLEQIEKRDAVVKSDQNGDNDQE